MTWKSEYLSTAIAYTDVPSTFKSFIKQQQRWKKGYLRANLFASLFFWSKKNPIIALLFYSGFLITVVAPLIMIIALGYGIFVLNEPLAPISLITGILQ